MARSHEIRPARRLGFTLIEMLTTMSIMAIMTTMAVVNFRSSEYSDELRFAAANLASEIRRAQTFALIGRPLSHCREAGEENGNFCQDGGAGCGSGRCVMDAPRGGYGIRIDPSVSDRATVFYADTGDADRNDASDHSYQDFELMRTLTFVSGQNVRITAVSPSADGVLDLTFVPPRPVTWINGEKDTPIAVITLTHERSGGVRTVRVNGISGQVSVE